MGCAAGLALVAGCADGKGAEQGPRRFRYAAAVEVPAAVTERGQLAALLAGFAHDNGLYFHDTTPRAERNSNGRETIALELQRPLTNGRPWPEIAVGAIGNGPATITFASPLDQGVAADSERGRADLLAALRRRWPATLDVPLLPDGGLPRQADLRRTPAGLRIDRAKAAEYRIPGNSPLLEGR